MAIYSDVNQFETTEKYIVENIESVYQSLFNIVNTEKRERLFQPTLGVTLENALFEIMDEFTAAEVRHNVLEQVGLQDPRVDVDWHKTEILMQTNEHKYKITLAFSIAGLENETFKFTGALSN